MAAQAGTVLLQVVAQLLGLQQHAARMVQEGFAGRRGPHAARLAVQQGHARLLLQRLDTQAGCGQGQVLPLRGAREAAQFGGMHEQAQVRQVEVHEGHEGRRGHGRGQGFVNSEGRVRKCAIVRWPGTGNHAGLRQEQMET